MVDHWKLEPCYRLRYTWIRSKSSLKMYLKVCEEQASAPQVWCISICVSSEDYMYDVYLSVSPVRITGVMHVYLCLQWGLQLWCVSICVSGEDYRHDVYLSVSPVRITGMMYNCLCLRWGLQVWCISICVSSEDYRYDVYLSVSPVRITGMTYIYLSPARITGMTYIYLCLQWRLQVWLIYICVSGEDYRYDVCLSVSPVRMTGMMYNLRAVRISPLSFCTARQQ